MAGSDQDKFKTPHKPTWCPGCGNYAIWTALKNAFVKMGLKPHDVLVVYGIGCHGHMVNWLKTYGFEGVHGRTLPLAAGAKIANQRLKVITVAGDGDQLSEGGNHLLHACRNNYDLTCLIHDNQIYGLTVGQSSPTTQKGFRSTSSPYGVIEQPLNPLALAITAGATFVARGFAGEVEHLTKLFRAAILHKGFAVVDILQPCVVFNYLNTYSWFYERVYHLEATHHKVSDKKAALERAMEGTGLKREKLPLGIFYQVKRPTFDEQLPQLKKGTLAEQPLGVGAGKMKQLLKEFR